ncbi:MAG: hypothetical protein AB2L11_09490 [Syntrophobacteraceae bacterium]
METLKAIWNGLVKFLTDYDTKNVADTLKRLDWAELSKNPLTWLLAIVIAGYCIWKKDLRLPILLLSVAAFLYLCQVTLPGSGDAVSLGGLIKFLGGTVALVAINGYFFFVREK